MAKVHSGEKILRKILTPPLSIGHTNVTYDRQFVVCNIRARPTQGLKLSAIFVRDFVP